MGKETETNWFLSLCPFKPDLFVLCNGDILE